MHLYDAIEEYNFTHGKHFDAATGQYDLLMPHDLGRPLTHEEMDYNFLYQKQTMNGFRIFGSGTNYKLNVDDLDKVLKFHKIQPTDENYALYTAAGYVDDQYIWIPVEMAAAAQPAYVTLTASPNPINETGNAVVTFTLNVVNVEDGTTIDWSIATGSGITAADFVGGLTGTATINGNTASWTVEAATDHITEGNEDFTLTLATTDSAGNDTTTMSQDANGNGGVPLNATVTIGDSSFTPRYNSISSANSVAEGNSITFTVNTDYFYQAATIPWEIDFANSTATAPDFTGPTSGTVNMDANGDGTFSVSVATDLVNDNENFTVKLVGSDSNGIDGQDRSKNVTISNAVFPTYTTFTGPATRLEGQNAQYALNGTNIPNGTQVGYTITGVDLSDISLNSLTGFITMNSNFGQLFFTCLEDNTVDGPDTMVVTLNNVDESGNATGLTPTLSVSTVISDVAPGYSITGPASIDEGNIGSYTFTASNMVPGTTVYWELRNYGASNTFVEFNSDFVSARTGNGNVQATSTPGEVELGIDIEIDTDIENEGAENFQLLVWSDASNYDTLAPYSGAFSGAPDLLASKAITINDLAPTYQIVGDATITEGQTKTYTFKATNFPAGTTVYWELRQLGVNPVDFTNDITSPRTGNGQVQTNGGFVELDIDITAAYDMVNEGSEGMKLAVWASDSSYDNTPPHNDIVTGAYATKDITISNNTFSHNVLAYQGNEGVWSNAETNETPNNKYEFFHWIGGNQGQQFPTGTQVWWRVETAFNGNGTNPNPVAPEDFVDANGNPLSAFPSGTYTTQATGTFPAESNAVGVWDVTLAEDNTTENTEFYYMRIYSDAGYTNELAEFGVSVDDTSQTPASPIHWLHWSSNSGYPSGSSLIVEPSGGWYLNNNTQTSDFDLVWADMVANQGTANNVPVIESYSASGGLTQSSIPNGTIGFDAIAAANRYYIAIPQSMSGDPSSTALFQLPDSANADIIFSGRIAFQISGTAYWLYDVGLTASVDALNLNLKNA